MKPWQRLVLALGALGAAGAALLVVVYSDQIAGDVIGQENMVFYLTPHELMTQKDKYGRATVRLGGTVVPGDDPDWDKQLPVVFYVSDNDTCVKIVSRGAPPQMFRPGINVLVEGKLEGDAFTTDRVIVAHDEKYEGREDNFRTDPLKTCS